MNSPLAGEEILPMGSLREVEVLANRLVLCSKKIRALKISSALAPGGISSCVGVKLSGHGCSCVIRVVQAAAVAELAVQAWGHSVAHVGHAGHVGHAP